MGISPQETIKQSKRHIRIRVKDIHCGEIRKCNKLGGDQVFHNKLIVKLEYADRWTFIQLLNNNYRERVETQNYL